MRIGKFEAGIREYGRNKFHWFYHPLLEENEYSYFEFFVWFGWHLYLCFRKEPFAWRSTLRMGR